MRNVTEVKNIERKIPGKKEIPGNKRLCCISKSGKKLKTS